MNDTTANPQPVFGTPVPDVAELTPDDMSVFFTREAANEGIKVELLDPKGNKTAHYLVLRGSRSDAMSAAREAMQRKLVDKDANKPKIIREFLASSIKGWSFNKACSTENTEAFLRDAPQIADQIERAIYNDANFTQG